MLAWMHVRIVAAELCRWERDFLLLITDAR